MKKLLVLVCLLAFAACADEPQEMQETTPPVALEPVLGDVIRIGLPEMEADFDSEQFETLATTTVASEFNTHVPEAGFFVYKADRGDRNGEYLTLWTRFGRVPGDAAITNAGFSPSTADKAQSALAPLEAHYANNSDVSDFVLIGSDQIDAQYSVDIIGLHVLKVLPERAADFEVFVKEKLHPVLAELMPGMPLLYYKGISGPRKDTYLLIFAIEDYEAREQYFPTDQPETPALYAALEPLEALGKELTTFQEPGSWLDPSSGGAAAYFESTEWTDFVRVGSATR